MTIPAHSDDLDKAVEATSLDDRCTIQPVMERLWEAQNAFEPRSAPARFFGRSPLAVTARALYAEAQGEIEVGESLRALATSGQAWRVLHSVPVGVGMADVAHIVIGPSGVFALATSDSASAVPSFGDALQGAARASDLLGAALGRDVTVRPLVVLVGEEPFLPRSQPADVLVVKAAALTRYLQRQAPLHSVDEVRELTRAALKPRTWQPREPLDEKNTTSGSETVPSRSDLVSWFAGVRAEVQGSRRVQQVWAGGLFLAFVAVLVEAPTVVQAMIG